MKIAFVMYNVLSTERMSVMLLSALAKQHFPHAEIDLFVYSDGKLEEQLKRFKPDIIAYSTMTGEHTHYLEIAKEVERISKKIGKKIFQIMGGPHCTFAPEILQGSSLDAIGVGECDDAWIDLLKELQAGRNVNNVQNIVTQENFHQVVRPANLHKDSYLKFMATNIRPRTCQDPENHETCLDHLPYLDWELFLKRTDFEKRNSLLKRTIMTRRGCPFFCTYCFNRVFNAVYREIGNQKVVHNFSVDRIIEECKWVMSRWPTEFWKIYDDTFIFSSKGKEGERLREFAEKWRKEINLPFFVLTRADLVAKNPDILRILKEAGCQSVTMSIEGGNPFVRNEILERKMSDEDIIRAHHLAWDLGIKTFSNVIYSVPASEEDIQKYNLPKKSIDRDIQSLQLALKSKVHFIECPMLFPYTGTKLGQICKEKGFFNGNSDKLHQSYQTLSPFDCLTLKEKRMSQNLAFLSMLCVYFGSRKNSFVHEIISPLFFKLVTKFLIRLPWKWCTKIYFLMYAIPQQWLCGSEIYRPKFRSPFTTFRIGFFERLKYEFAKQFPKESPK